MPEIDPSFSYNPIGNIEDVRKFVHEFTAHGDLKRFFSDSLEPFYDAMYDGLRPNAGHVLYRLSDFVDEQERKEIAIYPSSDGSLNVPHEQEGGGVVYSKSNSLEDWRKSWEKCTDGVIPTLEEMLPPESDISHMLKEG